MRRLWSPYVHRPRIYTNSPDPLIIRRPLFGHTGEGFYLSRTIRCVYLPYSLHYTLLPLLSMLMSTRSWYSRLHDISPPNEKTPPILIGQRRSSPLLQQATSLSSSLAVSSLLQTPFPIILTAVQISPTKTHYMFFPMTLISLNYSHYLLEELIEVQNLAHGVQAVD